METFNEVFELVCRYCKNKLSEVAYSLWISEIQPVKMDGSTAYLFVKSEFKKSIIEEKYLALLSEAFESTVGFPVKVEILCEEAEESISQAPPQINPYSNSQYIDADGKMSFSEHKEQFQSEHSVFDNVACMEGAKLQSAPDGEYEYTFSTFIVGQSNKFAHAASLAVATNPGKSYNPLFIYGASGLGKTHLLYAIKDEIQKNRPEKRIIYVKGEDFTNELIEAIEKKTTNEFHEKYRKIDVLLVDDIQFIGGKESTQEEFFHTFNTLYQAEKQIVLTSDRPPKEIKTLEDRLRTRFEWGLIADVQAPDYETRIAIIRRKAELLNLEIPNDVSEYIANRLKNNIRQLEGTVKKLSAYKNLAKTSPSILLAQNVIRDILNDNQPVPVTVERIISEVGRTFGVSPQDIRSNKRSSQISSARQVSIYVVREITQMSMADIGGEFGGRDHSTVVYNLQQVTDKMKKDTKYKETVEDIIKNIQNS